MMKPRRSVALMVWLILAGCYCIMVGSASAQVFLIAHPPYPDQARQMRLQGTGSVRVTFNEYFALPAKVEVGTSTGNRILDDAMVSWAREHWMVINFTAAERKDPRAMNERLKNIIPMNDFRRQTVQVFSQQKPVVNQLPLVKTIPVTFSFGR